uniref:Uncharacterized protein n=1 Tax=Rhizophora mucronata TaxID=61149 RepID=A0A2P2PTR2_RHIMU
MKGLMEKCTKRLEVLYSTFMLFPNQ